MAQVVKNNIVAQNVLNTLNMNNTELAKSLRKVSSGMKINGAGDGASEYSIGERMDVMIRSLGQDICNTKTGQSILKTAEGGIQEIINNIRSMKELAINSANDTNTDWDRATIEKEFSSRMTTIADIAATTNYNGKLLLNGEYYEPSAVEVTLPPVSISTPVSGRGIVPNEIDDLTKAFSAVSGTSVGGAFTRADLGASATKSYTGDPIQVKIDFSGALKDGSAPSCPADFDQQGFFILCTGCPQYVNIKFDASTSISTYVPNASTTVGMAREYVIGIKDVTDVANLPKAVFDGIKNATGRTEEALKGCYLNSDDTKRTDIAMPGGGTWNPDFSITDYKEFAKDSTDGKSIAMDGEHNLRILDNGDGTYSLWRMRGPSMGINDKGVHEIDPPAPSPTPRSTANYTKGNPLIIHTGTKANQHLVVYINSMHPIAMGLNRASVVTREKAVQSLNIVDKALEYSLNEITRIGAYQLELEHTENNLVIAEENTTSSKSTIQDADMAKEMQLYNRNNVLSQAAQSMLAQANQNLGSVLDLLQ